MPLTLLQQLKKQAEARAKPPSIASGGGASPIMIPPATADTSLKKNSSSSAIRYGLIVAFVVVLVIGVVLVVNRLHEQSHNANIVDRDDSADRQDLDVEAQGSPVVLKSQDPNFTPLSELI